MIPSLLLTFSSWVFAKHVLVPRGGSHVTEPVRCCVAFIRRLASRRGEQLKLGTGDWSFGDECTCTCDTIATHEYDYTAGAEWHVKFLTAGGTNSLKVGGGREVGGFRCFTGRLLEVIFGGCRAEEESFSFVEFHAGSCMARRRHVRLLEDDTVASLYS